MIIAYIDNGHIVAATQIRAVCEALSAHAVTDFGCIPLYEGPGPRLEIGRECQHCGAPLGSADPDHCKYIMLGTCSNCRC